MDSVNAYQYQRLKSKTDIRLLRLLPSHNGSGAQLSVELSEYSLMDADGLYTSLSYACGDTSIANRKAIICDGQRLIIYPRLYTALLKLRNTADSGLLWCDGICIDQGLTVESLQERSEQVRMMYEIYTHAKGVVVDLGDDLGEHQDHFVQVIHELAAISKSHWRRVLPFAVNHDDFGITESDSGPDDVSDKNSDRALDPDSPQSRTLDEKRLLEVVPAAICESWLWQTAGYLISRTYFTRLWVIQEHAFAREVHFMLGTTSVTGQIIDIALRRLSNIYYAAAVGPNKIALALSSVASPKFLDVDLIFRYRYFTQFGPDEDVWNQPEYLLYETRGFDCFDKRDRLYAILGLCQARHRAENDLRIDYGESLFSTCTRVSRYLVAHGAYFVLYRNIGCTASLKVAQPSWAIDFDMKEEDTLNALIDIHGNCGGGLFSAGMFPNSEPQTCPEIVCLQDPDRLATSAVILPEIESMSTAMRAWGGLSSKELRSELSSWFQNLSRWSCEQLSNNTYCLSPDTTFPCADVVFSTITAGLFQEMGTWQRASQQADSPLLDTAKEAFQEVVDVLIGSRPKGANSAEVHTMAQPLISSLAFAGGRRLAKSVPGTAGEFLLYLVPEDTLPGDVVGVIIGLPIPFVLRPVVANEAEQTPRSFRIVGTAYIEGCMDGQALKEPYKQETINLV